jgi:hypothetical protein
MRARDIVRHRSSGATGVVLESLPMMREDGQFVVFYDRSTVADAIGDNEHDQFEVIGRYDAAPDPEGCGMGKGERCCKFLGQTGQGLVCLRFGGMHWGLVFRDGKLREPYRTYPDCKLKAGS